MLLLLLLTLPPLLLPPCGWVLYCLFPGTQMRSSDDCSVLHVTGQRCVCLCA